jgi:hypothetical protein
MSDQDVSLKLFTKLVFDAQSELWNEFDLPRLRAVELQTLAQLVGAPKSGSKEKVSIRILAIRQVRLKLQPFADDVQAVAAAFRKEALKHMAREAGLWRSGNKTQLAAVLLSWRQRARAEGQKLLDQLCAASRQRPRQLDLGIA